MPRTRCLLGALLLIGVACSSGRGDVPNADASISDAAGVTQPSEPLDRGPGTTVGQSVPTGSSAPSEAPEQAPVLPVTITDDTGTRITITDVSRIIPVNGDLAEVVWALGLGDNVVATDISATYPAEADDSPKIGYQRALVAETLLSYSPTVILADELAGPAEVIDQLRTIGVPIVTINRDRTLDGPASKVTAVANALGVPRRGAALVATMQRQIDAALAAADEAVVASGRPKVLALYLRGTSVRLTFGEGSGVDVFIEAAGGLDVGTELGIVDTQQLSVEAIAAARPEIILVTTTGLESVGGIDGLLAIPGIDQTPAARDRRVLAYEDQYLYGFGPRIGQLLVELVDAFHPSS